MDLQLIFLSHPVTVCESSPVHHVDISPSSAASGTHRIAVTGASRIHIYNPAITGVVVLHTFRTPET